MAVFDNYQSPQLQSGFQSLMPQASVENLGGMLDPAGNVMASAFSGVPVGGYPQGNGNLLAQGGSGSFMDRLSLGGLFQQQRAGTTLGQSPLQQGMNTGLGLLQGYLGYQGLKLAKDQAKTTKRLANANLENQRSLTNTNMNDRQAARYAANPDAYQSPSSYMKSNGLKKQVV